MREQAIVRVIATR